MVRYLLTTPRYVQNILLQDLPKCVRIYVDANWAGCLRTRKSTLGGVICLGHMPVKTWSKTMPILALSSGESELAAVVKGAGEGLGFQSCMKDFGVSLPLEVHSDATAAIGMCKREGLGRVRHLSTADLWIQQLVRHNRLKLYKCGTEDNPADLMTKGLSRDRIKHLMQRLYFQLQGGRPTAAPIRANTPPLLSPMHYDVDCDGYDSE